MKRVLKIVGIIIGVLILIAIALPFFIDANIFRPRLESELSQSLGRKVQVGNLSLSLFSGGVKADNISIADDPAFSQQPFVHASSLKVGVELLPLIFSKELHVTELALDQPEINLVRSQNGEKWNFSNLGTPASSQSQGQSGAETGKASSAQTKPEPEKKTPSDQKPVKTTRPGTQETTPAGNPNLSVAKLNVTNGKLTVSRAGEAHSTRVYDKVNITVTNFSFTDSFPFKMGADLPGGGTLKLDGQAGPINAGNVELTPLQAKVEVKQMNLAQSGFLDPSAGISGIADFNGVVKSDGHEAHTDGSLHVVNLQVSPKGSPAGRPVDVKYAVTANLVKQSGTLTQGEVSMGKAVAHLSGTYEAHGNTTTVNLKLTGQGMPVDDLEAMLPALGVVLPPKSQLKGGTLQTNLTIVGPVDKLVTTGNVKLENSALAGFNLGSKMSAISALSGKNTGGNDTVIQNFSSDVRVAPEGTKADNINLTVPSLGVLTGAGTVSPSNELNFKMSANLSGSAVGGVTQMVGMGGGGKGATIPFTIQGTTADPKFMPDVKGMAGGLLQNALGGKNNQQNQQNPLGGVIGMFKKKPPK